MKGFSNLRGGSKREREVELQKRDNEEEERKTFGNKREEGKMQMTGMGKKKRKLAIYRTCPFLGL